MERSGFNLPVADLADTGWALVGPELLRLRTRIEAAGTPLRAYLKGRIYRGILTGLGDRLRD